MNKFAFKAALGRLFNKRAAQALVWVLADPDPSTGSSVWFDPITGFRTTNRHWAVEWVKTNKRGLRHYWVR